MSAKKDRLYEDVKFLTKLRPFRNYQNMESLGLVCRYIKKEFTSIGLTIKEQKWQARDNEYTNVIAVYNAGKNKKLIVGAHYDVCGNQPGADDNASAVAGLLETARLIAKIKPEIDYTIEFVAYCLEEPPFFGSEQMGSYVHAKSLYDESTDVIGMICYEMIGYFSDETKSQPYRSPKLAKLFPSTANFIIVVGIDEYKDFNNRIHTLMSRNSNIDVQAIHFPANSGSNGLAGLSDQRNYWKFGYQALMINDTSFIRNPNYHLPSDTIDTLDFDKMTEVINSACHPITNL